MRKFISLLILFGVLFIGMSNSVYGGYDSDPPETVVIDDATIETVIVMGPAEVKICFYRERVVLGPGDNVELLGDIMMYNDYLWANNRRNCHNRLRKSYTYLGYSMWY